MRPLFSRDLITIENAPPGGGVPVVTLPPAPVAPPQMAPTPVPTPPLPSPPSPVLPTPGIDIADDFVFDGVVLGNPSTPAEAFELLGYIPPSSPPSRGTEITCVWVEQHFDGSWTCHNRPQPEVSLDPMG